MRRVTVINPTPILDKIGKREAWGASPVHPNSIFYLQLADLVLDTMERLKVNEEEKGA